MADARDVLIAELCHNGLVTLGDCGRAADAILRALAEAGFVVVPKEATAKMVNAGDAAYAPSLMTDDYHDIWRAMVAAAGRE